MLKIQKHKLFPSWGTAIRPPTPAIWRLAVDPARPPLYIEPNEHFRPHTKEITNTYKRILMDELDLKKLETRVDDLIKAVDRLQQENKTLRDSQTSLMSERNQLIEKTELARSRVEAMIEKLRAMENE